MEKCNILIVEDEPLIMMLTKKMLQEMGYQPDVAANASEAFEMVGKHEYVLILSDIGLPDFDGIELAKRIRKQEKQTERMAVPIVAVTAYKRSEVQQKCLAAGIDDIYEKPLLPEQLVSILERHKLLVVI